MLESHLREVTANQDHRPCPQLKKYQTLHLHCLKSTNRSMMLDHEIFHWMNHRLGKTYQLLIPGFQLATQQRNHPLHRDSLLARSHQLLQLRVEHLGMTNHRQKSHLEVNYQIHLKLLELPASLQEKRGRVQTVELHVQKKNLQFLQQDPLLVNLPFHLERKDLR